MITGTPYEQPVCKWCEKDCEPITESEFEKKKIEPEKKEEKCKDYWWCPACQLEIDPVNVTYEETHEQCGNKVVIHRTGKAVGQGVEKILKQFSDECTSCARDTTNCCNICYKIKEAKQQLESFYYGLAIEKVKEERITIPSDSSKLALKQVGYHNIAIDKIIQKLSELKHSER